MKDTSRTDAGFIARCENGICLTSGKALIRVKDLSVRYGKHVALQNVSLDVAPCGITALIGPSGCGKTTFLSCFNRMIDLLPGCQASGSIVWAGRNLLAPDINLRALRRQIGMVFQKPNPFPLSIRKNITMPLREHGQKLGLEESLEKVLREVGLWNEVKDRLDAPALKLSGGQQQRLCIARTLALKPEIILFDEPCSALDPAASATIEELIYSLRQNFSVMIVTHNLAQARRIADDVGVFWAGSEGGRLIEFGQVQQVFDAPRASQTAAYISGRAG